MEIHARTILPLLAVMLIPTIAVFFGIKKPLLKRETRKLLEKKLGSTPITNDVLTSVYWALSNQEYISNDAFTKDIIDYIPDNKDNWNPYGIAVNTRKVCIVYEAFITGAEQLRSNEHIVDINDLENLHSNEWRFFIWLNIGDVVQLKAPYRILYLIVLKQRVNVI